MRVARVLCAFALGWTLFGCSAEPTPADLPPNILFLIADDLATDMLGAYADQPLVAATPTIDSLARRGVLFRNAWGTPMCSSTRASILTGTLPSTHGIGDAISNNNPARRKGLDLSRGLVTLPQLLRERGYEAFVAGKWHLGPGGVVAPRHVLEAGFDHHAGTYANLGGMQDYFGWMKYVDGEPALRGGYLTTDTVDDALRFIEAARKPWLGWVAFNAIHMPLHHPPSELYSVDLHGELDSPPRRARAMVEALDTEMGRLLRSIDPEVLARTVVVFLSDNGAWSVARGRLGEASKGSVFEAGLNVPFIVSGAAVPAATHGTQSDALVHVLDLYAAAAEWAGASLPAGSESVSFVPYLTTRDLESLRPVLFSEQFTPNGGPPDPLHHQRAARNARFKLIDVSGKRSFYDLEVDPTEQLDLLRMPLTGLAAGELKELERALDLRGDPEALHSAGPVAAEKNGA